MSGALREGGHVDAARCAERLGCLPAEGGADGADSAGTLRSNLQPPEPSQRAMFCYSTQVNSHTQPAMLHATQEGKSGDFFIPACSFTRNHQTWSPGGWGGMKLGGKVGVKLLNVVSLSSFDL